MCPYQEKETYTRWQPAQADVKPLILAPGCDAGLRRSLHIVVLREPRLGIRHVRIRPVRQADDIRADVADIRAPPCRVVLRVVERVEGLYEQFLHPPVQWVEVAVVIQSGVLAAKHVAVLVDVDIPAGGVLVVVAWQLE